MLKQINLLNKHGLCLKTFLIVKLYFLISRELYFIRQFEKNHIELKLSRFDPFKPLCFFPYWGFVKLIQIPCFFQMLGHIMCQKMKASVQEHLLSP